MWASSRKQAGPVLGGIAPRALEYAAAVVDDVRRRCELAPDSTLRTCHSSRSRLAALGIRHEDSYLLRDSVTDSSAPRRKRAFRPPAPGAALRQCQQKRGWGLSRARSRDSMPATLSSRLASARPGRARAERAARSSRAARTSSGAPPRGALAHRQSGASAASRCRQSRTGSSGCGGRGDDTSSPFISRSRSAGDGVDRAVCR